MTRSGPSISPPPTKRRRIIPADRPRNEAKTLPVPSSSASPPPHWLRIYSWNINGIAPFLQSSIASFVTRGPAASVVAGDGTNPVASLRSMLQRNHWPQIVHLQEVKINPSDVTTQAAIRKAVNKRQGRSDQGPTYTVQFSLPRDMYNAIGFGRKVYGVATIIREDFFQDHVERVREVSWDREGRILVIETKSKLALFNIYAVNGTDNVYKNSDTGKPQGTRHDRKLEFHRLLMEEAKQFESRGYWVVLAGDINVAPAQIDGYPKLRTFPEQHVKNREDFQSKFLRTVEDGRVGLHAVDSFRHLHPESRKYSWLSRSTEWMHSCDRVDLILVSRSLVEAGALKEADICMTIADRGPSDHCPIYLSLDIQ